MSTRTPLTSATPFLHFTSPPVLALLLSSQSAQAEDFYVAVDGNDGAGTGTMGAPYASVERAESDASPGDTIYIRGGTYAFTGSGTLGVRLTKDGQNGAPISYVAYPGETPIFDLSDLTPSNRVTGIDLQADWIHISGLEVTGVHQYMSGQDSWGVRIRGDNNVLENLNVHHNDAPGIFITSGANNLVLNCDSHHNYDFLENGGSGDGFGCHSTGSNNVMRGCRAWENSDDGYDFINAPGSCLVEESFAFRNGWQPDTNTAAGNGAGFKAGGYGSPPNTPAGGAATHTVQKCVAFNNRSQGFYANHHDGRIYFTNNLSFANSTNYDMLADSGYPSDHVLRNNVALSPGGEGVSRLTGGSDDNNSWTLGVTAENADYLSLALELALSARDAEGNLAFNDFARLVDGSDLIDAGVDVGLPYLGASPDLGPFEFGEDEPSGTGGDAGTGGGGNSGGAPAAGGFTASGAGSPLGTGGLESAGGDTGGCTCSLGENCVMGVCEAESDSEVDDDSASETDAGCACSTPGSRGPSDSVSWVLLAGLLTLLRRRVRA